MKITDFRPINQCNLIYKIITKALANQLKGVLDPIICLNQSAFVSGRLITDNIIVAYELLHGASLSRVERMRKPQARYEQNLCKAWIEFVEMMICRLSFLERWRLVVMDCITSLSYSFCINGSVKVACYRSEDYVKAASYLCTFFLFVRKTSRLFSQNQQGMKTSRDFHAINECPRPAISYSPMTRYRFIRLRQQTSTLSNVALISMWEPPANVLSSIS